MGKKGFTLIEAMIALFLLSVVLLGLAGYVSTEMKTVFQSKQTSLASSLIQDKMESFRNVSFALLTSGNDAVNIDGVTYSRRWVITQAGNMKNITIGISYGIKNINATTVRGE